MDESAKSPSSSADPLVCPSCGLRHALDERFCSECGMPLVYAGETTVRSRRTEAQLRARKVSREYTDGELVRVAGSRNQAEAELIQGMLLEEGVPSVLRRTPGFDVPDFLAAGPRDVMVPESGAEVAREVLRSAELAAPETPPTESFDTRIREIALLLAAILGGGAVAALIAWALLQGA